MTRASRCLSLSSVSSLGPGAAPSAAAQGPGPQASHSYRDGGVGGPRAAYAEATAAPWQPRFCRPAPANPRLARRELEIPSLAECFKL